MSQEKVTQQNRPPQNSTAVPGFRAETTQHNTTLPSTNMQTEVPQVPTPPPPQDNASSKQAKQRNKQEKYSSKQVPASSKSDTKKKNSSRKRKEPIYEDISDDPTPHPRLPRNAWNPPIGALKPSTPIPSRRHNKQRKWIEDWRWFGRRRVWLRPHLNWHPHPRPSVKEPLHSV